MIALVGEALAGTVFEGPEVVDAVSGSVEVNDSLLQVLQAQARYDRHLSHLSLTSRWAPGKFELADGRLVAGNLHRTLVGGGVGLGHPSKGGVHAGLAMDVVGETGAKALRYMGYQEILYFGFGVKNVQVTLNARVDFLGDGSGGLDPWRQFQSEDTAVVPERPPPVDWSTRTTHGQTFSVYHGPSGAWSYVTWQGTELYDLRLQLQPLVHLLPDAFGLPAVGVRWLQDQAQELVPAAATGTATGTTDAFAALQPEEPTRRLRTDLGTDDALHVGMRTRVIVEWVPVPAFRYAELGLVRSLGELEDLPLGFGLRAAVGVPEDRARVAVESFGMLGLGESERWSSGSVGHVALSYSYNVPDGTTYLPIPDAHVFGVQLVLGPPETSKPIVPLVRGLPDAR